MITEIHGTCDPHFEPLRDAFAENFESEGEVGASVAVTVAGEFVADLWGGYADGERSRPWGEDTLVNVWSCTKAMTTICILRLMERGELDIEKPVAHYWPAFGQEGKADIPVRLVLTHQAGVPQFSDQTDPMHLVDGDWTYADLESMAPAWEPGSAFQYHALTFGTILGRIVREITGKTVGTMFRREVAEPLGVDFHIGLAAEQHHRVAETVFDSSSEEHELPDFGFINRPDIRAAEMPAANGHGNARSMARVMAALANGGELDGVRILQRETIEAAIAERLYEIDISNGRKNRRGLGFMLASLEFAERRGVEPAYYPGATDEYPSIFGHDGIGGSFAFADLDRRFSWGYAMNNIGDVNEPNTRVQRLSRALFACLG